MCFNLFPELSFKEISKSHNDSGNVWLSGSWIRSVATAPSRPKPHSEQQGVCRSMGIGALHTICQG